MSCLRNFVTGAGCHNFWTGIPIRPTSDDWDRRCLMDILSQFFHPSILREGHVFSKSGIYYAPPEGNLDSYRCDLRPLSPMHAGMDACLVRGPRVTLNLLQALWHCPLLPGSTRGSSPWTMALRSSACIPTQTSHSKPRHDSLTLSCSSRIFFCLCRDCWADCCRWCDRLNSSRRHSTS
jgi:hypothetical protein